jgi:hypothetical protein
MSTPAQRPDVIVLINDTSSTTNPWLRPASELCLYADEAIPPELAGAQVLVIDYSTSTRNVKGAAFTPSSTASVLDYSLVPDLSSAKASTLIVRVTSDVERADAAVEDLGPAAVG